MPGLRSPWDTKRFALYGALLGMVGGIIRSFIDAFSRQAPDSDQTMHVLSVTVLFVVAGALLLAMVAAVRNWFLQSR